MRVGVEELQLAAGEMRLTAFDAGELRRCMPDEFIFIGDGEAGEALATMKDHSIFRIYTEDRAFALIPWLTGRNPVEAPL